MREILFRGKTDKGEWVEGDLLHPDLYGNGYSIEDFTKGKNNCFDVIPETIGQYTGLTDKNGKKIFEGDVVKTHSGLLGEVVFGTFFDDEFECDVQGYFWISKDVDGIAYKLALSVFWGGHEIIGNIHDNPELLDGKGEGE